MRKFVYKSVHMFTTCSLGGTSTDHKCTKQTTKRKFVAQTKPALYFWQHLNFLQPAANIFLAPQLDHAR